MKPVFEMANGNDPEEIILATQRSLIEGLRNILKDVQKDVKTPGLTWQQLDELLVMFGNKKPTIIVQKDQI
jgi:hypothetical protein